MSLAGNRLTGDGLIAAAGGAVDQRLEGNDEQPDTAGEAVGVGHLGRHLADGAEHPGVAMSAPATIRAARVGWNPSISAASRATPVEPQGVGQDGPQPGGQDGLRPRRRRPPGQVLPLGGHHLAGQRQAEDPPDLEEADVGVLAVDVEADGFEQAGDERRAQQGLGAVQRIFDLHGRAGQPGPLEVTGRRERSWSTPRTPRRRPGCSRTRRRCFW